MKTRLLLLMATVAFALPMWAQWGEDIDTLCPAQLMVMYELTYREDTNHLDRAGKEKMMLLIGEGISYFESYNSYRSTRKIREIMNKGIREIHVQPEDIARYIYKVFKNHPLGKITMIDNVFMTGVFLYEEDYPCMTWEYTADTAIIAGQFTQNATCDYGGRTWEAWFAPELPYQEGPYKFCGLPGLIVKIADTQNHYCFEMVSAEIPEDMFIVWENRDYVETTKKAFFKAYDDNLANIVENALPNILDADKSDIQKKLYYYAVTKNNPIELDRK
ncbi:MAG: GLPGLI family protein [Bacteroidales bacterium]|nr:GLPGLI family protein [Bacteroidales bacterium]